MAKYCPMVVWVSLASMLAGCASHEVVPPSGPRAATTPESIKLYAKHPKRYEQLGMVAINITPDMRWDQRGDSPLAFEALKAKAAKLGANGLLFILPPENYEYLVTVGYQGEFYQVPARRSPKTAMAQAIYVLEQ